MTSTFRGCICLLMCSVYTPALTTSAASQTLDSALDAYVSNSGIYVTAAARRFAKSFPASGQHTTEWLATRDTAKQATTEMTLGHNQNPKEWETMAGWLSGFLWKLPTIVLHVQPIPPKNYQVRINGENCPLTDQAKYLVPPGATVVEVTFPGKKACKWSGSLSESDQQNVDCEF
jgi:hypothetical protein